MSDVRPFLAPWPVLPPYDQWRETCSALHLWSQIVGKYRLAHTPWVNHSWHATLYVTPRGGLSCSDDAHDRRGGRLARDSRAPQ
jgi:hypothetical protein